MKSFTIKCLLIAVMLSISLSSQSMTSQNMGWEECASKENDDCKFVGHRLVRFGENGNFTYKLGEGNIKCSTSHFVIDPSPGKAKKCDFYSGNIVWRQCATNGGKCDFTGKKFVRYGNSSDDQGRGWNIKLLADGTDCTNTVFQDSTASKTKTCWVGEDFNPSLFYWKYCTDQYSNCKFKGTQIVRYGGIRDSWVYFYGNNSVPCNDSVLGDPVFGYGKRCSYQAINEDSCPNDSFLNEMQCVSKCPEGTLISVDNKSCLKECPGTQVFFTGTNNCVEDCPNGYYIKRGGECIPCEKGTYTSIDHSSCVSQCPDSHFLIKSTKRCHPYCPSNYKVILSTNECIYDCAENNLLITADHGYCTDICPEGQFKLGSECFFDCPFSYLRNGRECVPQCPEGTYRSADNRSCVTQCREGSYLLKADKQCYSRCPQLSYENGNECVYDCPAGTIKSYDNYECLTKCPKDHYLYKATNSCFSVCPGNLFISQNECVDTCPTGTVLSADKRNCVSNCGKNQFFIAAYNSCFYRCPYGYSHGLGQCK